MGFLYIMLDPFKVLRNYKVFYDKSNNVGVNRSYVSTMTYLNQRENLHYNSFIFGNSRSMFYEVDEWKKYLPKNCKCFHFDASSGSIKTLYDMVRIIDECGDTIKNAIIVMDHELLSRTEITSGYLYMEPSILKHGEDVLKWQTEHFKAFINPVFLTAYLDYRLFKTYRPYMGQYIQAETSALYNQETNEFRSIGKERLIKEGKYFTSSIKAVFKGVQEPNSFSKHRLNSTEIFYFKEMARVLRKHHSNYRIVLGPQYDQVKINSYTLHCLNDIFGRDRIYNYTGINKWNTDYHNYYEQSHYRPHVAAEVMKEIYK